MFNALPREEAERLWLTVVGETWEGCTEPAHLIATSPHADRITFVNEYVPDEVVGAAFAHADVAVLPYRRSSSSGILHVAMSWGLPIVRDERRRPARGRQRVRRRGVRAARPTRSC